MAPSVSGQYAYHAVFFCDVDCTAAQECAPSILTTPARALFGRFLGIMRTLWDSAEGRATQEWLLDRGCGTTVIQSSSQQTSSGISRSNGSSQWLQRSMLGEPSDPPP